MPAQTSAGKLFQHISGEQSEQRTAQLSWAEMAPQRLTVIFCDCQHATQMCRYLGCHDYICCLLVLASILINETERSSRNQPDSRSTEGSACNRSAAGARAKPERAAHSEVRVCARKVLLKLALGGAIPDKAEPGVRWELPQKVLQDEKILLCSHRAP